jgi:hypothetical protein
MAGGLLGRMGSKDEVTGRIDRHLAGLSSRLRLDEWGGHLLEMGV